MAGVDERSRPATSRKSRRLSWSGGGITRNDLLLAGVVLVLQLGLSAVAEGHHAHSSHLDVAEWLLLLVGPAGLLAWRRHPVVVLWVAFLATAGPATPLWLPEPDRRRPSRRHQRAPLGRLDRHRGRLCRLAVAGPARLGAAAGLDRRCPDPRRLAGRAGRRGRGSADATGTGRRGPCRPAGRGAPSGQRRTPANGPGSPRRDRPQHFAHQHPSRRWPRPHRLPA